MKKKLLFVITQFYKGGAEVALLNLFRALPQEEYEVDFLVFDQMPIRGAKSLLAEVPPWVRVCNAAEKEGRLAVLVKVWFKVWGRLTGHQLCRPSAKRFVRGKEYDAAFSYGEWMSPEFVARRVRAGKKMVWVHADIDKAQYVNGKRLFRYDGDYDRYIFVSAHSREAAERRFPGIKGKSATVHNLCDGEAIRKAAGEGAGQELPGLPPGKRQRPLLVSVGNLREEKNYPRQVEVMRILKGRGWQPTWLCIGSTANAFLHQKVRGLVQAYGLGGQFLLLGADPNPYRYMQQADAVMVLSDHESWSMVITEAKLLGVPVVATATSGAKEQITDGEDGLLAPFGPEGIADVVERLLRDGGLQARIRRNLEDFSLRQGTVTELEELLR